MKNPLEGLKPSLLWHHFYALSQIPRCSKHEAQVTDYVLGVAGRCGAGYQSDETGNVVISIPASSGCTEKPGVILQAHLDMVCEKNKETSHDFFTEGLRLKREEDWVCAEGTTLGADNGIGVAACLAVLESDAIRHGPLELLLTVDEETGLTGAMGLDPYMVHGRMLINMDSEEDGALYIGCAGGRDTELFLAVETDPAPQDTAFRLHLGGLRGGHSGIEIDKGRGNAIRLLSRFLWQQSESFGIRLAGLEGGNKHNAIPRECEALLFVPEARLDSLKEAVSAYEKVLQDEYAQTEDGVFFTLTPWNGKEPETVFKSAFQDRLLNVLFAMPNGVIAMSHTVSGLVQTSTNLAIVDRDDSQIRISTSQRSATPSQLDEIVDTVCALGRQAGARMRKGEGYPGWKPDLDSLLLKTAQSVFQARFGSAPAIKAIHAGLECGLIGDKFPGMDMISFGPTITGAHSPSERVQISTVATFWDFLVALIEELAG